MFFAIVNAVLSAILFLIVVLPPLYIYNPNHHPGESNEPPSAGEVIPDDMVSHAVKQKLYLLFIIPTCAVVNAIFLYFAYYRPIRFIHYRVELNLLTLRLTLDAGRQQLQKSGVLTAPSRGSYVSNYSIGGTNNNSMVARNFGKTLGRSIIFDGNETSRQRLDSSVKWEWRRHARPKSVRRDAWVNSAVFAEISELRDEVEQHFLLEGSVADANFAKAVVKTAGAFAPAATSTMLESQTQLPKPNARQEGFYNSSSPPLMNLGARPPAAHLGGKENGTANNGVVLQGGPRSVNQDMLSQRADSVIMVPTESAPRKNGSSAGAGGRSGVPGAALRLLRGVHINSGSSGNRSNQGNRVEASSPAQASPLRRDAFEPVTMDDMSPVEPLNDETAVRRNHNGGDGGNGARVEGEAQAAKQSLWARRWHRNENKTSS